MSKNKHMFTDKYETNRMEIREIINGLSRIEAIT